MSIPKCHWMVIVVNLVKKTWFGVVLYMLGQYCVFPSLAAIITACLLQGVAGVLQGFLPIYPAGLGGAHHNSGAGCPSGWLHGTIHPKYVLWGYILAILQAAPSWSRYPAEGNQGLPKHGEVWRYCLGSSSYPWNATWQMALRCFTKYLYRGHQWGSCRGAQEAIWHHCKKLRRRVRYRHQLGPYKTGTFAGSADQVKACHLLGKVGIVTEYDILPKGHCQVLPPLCPLQAEKVVVGSQQRLSCGSIGTVTTGQEPVVDGFPASPHSIQIPYPCHQGPSLLEHPGQIAVLTRFRLPRSPLGLVWYLSASGSMPLGLYSLRRRLISKGIPILNLRRSSDRLRFIMGIPIPVRRRLLSE